MAEPMNHLRAGALAMVGIPVLGAFLTTACSSRFSKPSNPFAGFNDPEFDGGAAVPVLPHCAETFARGNECTCQ